MEVLHSLQEYSTVSCSWCQYDLLLLMLAGVTWLWWFLSAFSTLKLLSFSWCLNIFWKRYFVLRLCKYINILFQFKLLLAGYSIHLRFAWNKNEVFPKCWFFFSLFSSFLPMCLLAFCKDQLFSAPFIYLINYLCHTGSWICILWFTIPYYHYLLCKWFCSGNKELLQGGFYVLSKSSRLFKKHFFTFWCYTVFQVHFGFSLPQL